MATDVGVSLPLDTDLKLFSRQTLVHQIITDTNNAVLYEIHVWNFIFLIQNESNIMIIIELLWSEAKAHIVKELGWNILTLRQIGVKEISKFVDHVVVQIVQ